MFYENYKKQSKSTKVSPIKKPLRQKIPLNFSNTEDKLDGDSEDFDSTDRLCGW